MKWTCGVAEALIGSARRCDDGRNGAERSDEPGFLILVSRLETYSVGEGVWRADMAVDVEKDYSCQKVETVNGSKFMTRSQSVNTMHASR